MVDIPFALRLGLAVVVYAASIWYTTYTSLWLNNLGMTMPALAKFTPRSIDGQPLFDLKMRPAAAAAWDVGLLCLFFWQHNLMARTFFKDRSRRAGVPFPLERTCFAAAATLALAIIINAWQPLWFGQVCSQGSRPVTANNNTRSCKQRCHRVLGSDPCPVVPGPLTQPAWAVGILGFLLTSSR